MDQVDTPVEHPPITAELRDAVRLSSALGEVLFGRIYGDTKGRFPDGMEVRTSIITEIGPSDVFTTETGGTYRVTSWWRGAGSKRWDVV